MPPIKTLEEAPVYILGDWTWEAFETIPDGHLRLAGNEVEPYCADFYMRVGLHLERPVQAIVSCGKFIRLRRDERWTMHFLNKIDPTDPYSSLYIDFDNPPPLSTIKTVWKPT
jgi:hypothetical protein